MCTLSVAHALPVLTISKLYNATYAPPDTTHITFVDSYVHIFHNFMSFLKKRNFLTVFINTNKTSVGRLACTGWRTKCHTIDCTHITFLLLQKHFTSGTELILIGWKIVPNESL